MADNFKERLLEHLQWIEMSLGRIEHKIEDLNIQADRILDELKEGLCSFA